MPRPKIWRTTTFRLTLVFGAVFAAGIVALLSLIYASSAVYLTKQMDQIVIGQAQALYGVPVAALPEKLREVQNQDVRSVYYYGLFSDRGDWIAGNVRHLPKSTKVNGVPRALEEPGFQPGARAEAERLPSGDILFVGFDAKILTGLREILLQSLIWSGALIIVLGLGLGALLSLAPLRRIQAVQQASRPIMDGDLGVRLPTSNRRDEIDMLAGIANNMMDEVERLLWAVKSVGDNVAHDLRTPLTRLRALLYDVNRDLVVSPSQRAMLDQALGETDALLARFKAIQRISEVDRRKRRAGFAEVRLGEVLRAIADLYEPLAEDHGLDLVTRIECPGAIPADGELLFEALSNLVGNAVKFTPAGGRVSLTLVKTDEGPRLEIADSGPGVPEDERDVVLQRFYRGRNQQDVPGSGLGLSIVAAVARLHDFRLELGDAAPGLRVTLDCWPAAMSH